MTIKELFNKHPELETLLDQNEFEKIYSILDSEERPIFTDMCYGVLQINPLEYLTEIPSHFLSNLLNASAISTITIPSNIKIINKYAFFICPSLTSLQIPDSVIAMHEAAIWSCSNLTDLRLSENLKLIPDRFCCHSGIDKIILPSSIEWIGTFAFSDCKNLSSIDIPEGVITIGNGAFYKCSKLTHISIPASIERIEASAFECGQQLTDLDYAGTKAQWKAIKRSQGLVKHLYTVHCIDGDLQYKR